MVARSILEYNAEPEHLGVGFSCGMQILVGIAMSGMAMTVALKRHSQSKDEVDSLSAGSSKGRNATPPPKPWLSKHWDIVVLIIPLLVLFFIFQSGKLYEPSNTGTSSKADYSCAQPDRPARVAAATAAVKGNTLTITTDSPDASVLFQFGIIHAWGFNQWEAGKSFSMASTIDEACAMCVWGVAYSLGPFTNRVYVQDGTSVYPNFSCTDLKQAYLIAKDAVQRLERREHKDWEVAIINLTAKRFAVDSNNEVECLPDNRAAADRAYGHALIALGKQHQDASIIAMGAEALINLIPWDYQNEDGTISAEGTIVLTALNDALKLDPAHALALHLKVHELESVGRDKVDPDGNNILQQALEAAEHLAAANFSQNHLLHMPAHVYVRVGRYADAVKSNELAYERAMADSGLCIAPYSPEHDLDLLIFAAGMAGMTKLGEWYALEMRTLRQRMPTKFIAEGIERTAAQLMWVRFAQFQNLQPELWSQGGVPLDARGQTGRAGFEYAVTVAIFSELMASACEIQQLRQEASGASAADSTTTVHQLRVGMDRLQSHMTQLEEHAAKIPVDLVTEPGHGLGLYSSGYNAMGRTHVATAKARLASLSGDHAEAAQLLQETAELQDSLGYIEPFRLHHPVRHCLVYVLLQGKQWKAALDVGLQDLEENAANGWSLLAAAEASEGLGRADAQREYETQAAAAFAHADVKITSPCPSFKCQL